MRSFSMSILRKTSRYLTPVCAISGIILINGCSTPSPSHETFPTPDYTYLPPLNLNVATVDVKTPITAESTSLTAQSPYNPISAMELMGHQRLHATGSTGAATLTLLQADISKAPHHMLNATFKISLALDDAKTNHHGHITATIHHLDSAPPQFSKEHNLYVLNQKMMEDMNVEIEYQIKKNLTDWLTDATGTPLNASIQSQDLAAPIVPTTPQPIHPLSSNPSPQNNTTLHIP